MRHQTIQNARLLRDLGTLCLMAFTFLALSSSSAWAQAAAGTDVGTILCDIYALIQGSVGRGIATLAVASLGISALVGKVSWGMAIMVSVGIAVMFGAGSLITDLNIPGISGC
jgi:type IV secretory pathway VirB2 component (pilin)